MSNEEFCNNDKITKLNQYFYMTPGGEIFKYKKYCIINDCKKTSSFNYSGKKELLYCNEHKLDKMVNIKKGYSFCEKHNISYINFVKNAKNLIVYYVIKLLIKNIIFQKNILIILIKILQ